MILGLHSHKAVTGQSCVPALFSFISKLKFNTFKKIVITFLCFKISKVLKSIQWKSSSHPIPGHGSPVPRRSWCSLSPRNFSCEYKQIYVYAYSPPFLFHVNGKFYTPFVSWRSYRIIRQNFAHSFCRGVVSEHWFIPLFCEVLYFLPSSWPDSVHSFCSCVVCHHMDAP